MDNDGLNRGLEGITVTETQLSSIDGKKGGLIIGGFPIDELAANATYEESAFLLLNDQLPTADELTAFRTDLAAHREISDETQAMLRRAAEEDKPPMDALRMGVAAANLGIDDETTQTAVRRVIAVFPTIVSSYWRYRQGKDPVLPRRDLRHSANYLYMLTGREPTDAAMRGLETYLNTVIDHGLNASTFTARVVVSSESDVMSAGPQPSGRSKARFTVVPLGPCLTCSKKCMNRVTLMSTSETSLSRAIG